MIQYPLATTTWDEKELQAINHVALSGKTSMGPLVAEYEASFANYLGSKHCVMVNSGSSANLLMVGALFYRKNNRLNRGDEVIVPAVSWPTTYYPLSQYGLKLKFVDIDLETLNYDLTKLKYAITDKTRLIMAVNLLGNPNDFKSIKSLIGNRNIELIEDNCESLGATFDGKQAGTFGCMGSYSMFFSHHISTMEGGIVATDDEELYHILLSLRAHGWTRNLPKHNHVCSAKSDDPFEESFRFVLPGYNVRPLEMSGAIGIEQVKKLPDFIKVRRENAEIFRHYFANHKDFMMQKEISKSSWFGFTLIIKPESSLTRPMVVKRLTEGHVECRPIVAGNFAKNEVLKWFDHEISGTLANAEYLDSRGLFVGNHQFPLEKEIKHLAQLLS